MSHPLAALVAHVRKDLPAAIVLTLASLGVGLMFNQARSHPLPILSGAGTHDAAGDSEFGDFSSEIDLLAFRKLFQDGCPRVFDVRPPATYRAGHIPGAENLPYESLRKSFEDFRAELEQDKMQPLILYCGSLQCSDAKMVQRALRNLGFQNVSVYRGGFAEWKEHGLPLHTQP